MRARIIKFITFFFIALVFSTQFNIEHKWLLYSQLVFISLGFLSFFLKKPQILLGLALPTLPFFPYGTLSSFILCFNFCFNLRLNLGAHKYLESNKSNLLFKLLLLPLFLSLVVCFYFEFDFYIFKTMLLNTGILETYLFYKKTRQ